MVSRFPVFVVLGCLLAQFAQGLPQQEQQPATPNAANDALNRYGYEDIGGGKYAAVINRFSTWEGAFHDCRSHIPGASLFVVNSPQDSNWLGSRINFEKDRITGSSKFWVGLFSRRANAPLTWLDGSAYQTYPEVVQVSGNDDSTKNFAWAVPDSFTKLKYEFLTIDDEAEAYICQYVPA